MREADLKKRLFAIEYYKNGCNATKAAESVGYSPKTARQHGHTLLKDKVVKAELKALNELLSLDKLSQPDKDKIEKEVADINEVLTTLTKILRREMPEDNVVIVKANKTEYEDDKKTVSRTEEAQIVETRTRPGDVNKAADLLLKYYEKANGDSDEEKGGVVILAEIRKE
ncbi:MAG: terminase small subunit [Clostridia bacterium]|nr:terminase small subunit [Clostridia bacterium]